MIKNPEINLDERSLYLRRLIVRLLIKGGRGHVGSAMSLVEILRVLYDDILNIRPKQPKWIDRDRCILSKGHGCLALYAILADKGFFPIKTLDTFCKKDSILGGHPEHGKVPGVEASTGSLGHGLGFGMGMCLALKINKSKSRVFVILGDGEINEGSIWEGAMTAAKHSLKNLTVIIDCNGLQSYGSTEDVLNMSPLAEKWRAFGFNTTTIDGHDIQSLQNTFSTSHNDRPQAIICNTIKGKGIPAAEHNPHWHHKSKLSSAELATITASLGTL